MITVERRVLSLLVELPLVLFYAELHYRTLRKLPLLHISSRLSRACLVLPHSRVDLINSVQRQAQELMLVVPPYILLLEVLRLLRWWRRIRNFGNEIGC
jgi:hypothetical protein